MQDLEDGAVGQFDTVVPGKAIEVADLLAGFLRVELVSGFHLRPLANARGSALSSLHLERTAAATRGFDLGVIELEPGSLQRFHEVDLRAIQIEKAGLLAENLQPDVI